MEEEGDDDATHRRGKRPGNKALTPVIRHIRLGRAACYRLVITISLLQTPAAAGTTAGGELSEQSRGDRLPFAAGRTAGTGEPAPDRLGGCARWLWEDDPAVAVGRA